MAIPNKYIDKIKDKDSGESRPICPPAEHVSVDNENFEGETLDEVLDEVARSIEEAGQGGYAPPAGGIPKTDLAQSVQDSLDKADSALQDEDVAEVAKTGDYNDLEHKPTIPDTSGLATKTELNAKQDTLVAGNGIVVAQDGKTVSVDAEVVQPVTADGTFAVRIGGNTYTINLNHSHPQYLTAQLLKAGSNVSISVNQQTGEVTINAAGGSGGTITSITMNGAAVSVNNGVANLGNVVTPQSLASEGFAKIVKTTQAAYDALTPKDENTLYIIPYLGSSKAGKTYLGRDLIWEYEPPFAVPYDAVVEYLESTGTQYFDTGIIENTRNFEVTLEAAWTGTNSNQTEILFGYMAYPAEPQYPNFQIYKSQGKWGFSPTNANILTDISIDHNKHTFFVTENETANTADVSIDGGTPTRLTTNDYGIATNTLHHFIGGRSENDGFFQRSSSARFYRLNYKKFADAAHQTLIKEWNFIPVRVENVGYMYDTISKQLYSAQGGAFIVGNDITT